MPGRILSWCWRHPAIVWLIVLAALFGTEYTVMLVLPLMIPGEHSGFLEATVDSFILTAVIAPLMWGTVVRPLQEVLRLRTRYLTDLFARVESNKRKVAHELHDGIGQTLSLLVSGLRTAHESVVDPEAAARCESLLQLARSALKDVKRLAIGLRPSLLDDLGLVPALERLVADIREQHSLDVTLQTDALTDSRIPENLETVVFRIIQEGLANVVTHAKAMTATVVVSQHRGDLCIEIRDDGCGFESPDQKIGAQGHLGLLGMRERATLLGGRFSIDSTPGYGARIQVKIPLKGGAHAQDSHHVS